MATDAPTSIGKGYGVVRGYPGDLTLYFCEVPSGSAYATGGVDLTLPTEVKGLDLLFVIIANPNDGTRVWQWDGSRTAPKLFARDAFVTQEGAGAITPVTLDVMMVFASS